MTNATAQVIGTAGSNALNLHASEIVAGITRKIILRNPLAAIERGDADAVI